MYRVRVLDAATRELERLDRVVGRRIVERINWLAANFETIRPEALTGDLAGFYKLRAGAKRSSRCSTVWRARLAERGDFAAAILGGYEETWRAHLGREIAVRVWVWGLAARLTPDDLDALAEPAITDGLMAIIWRTARLNWHRELVVQTLRHPGVLQIVLRRLLETSLTSP